MITDIDQLWAAYKAAVLRGDPAVTPPPGREIEVCHDWVNCFIPGCLACVWWDICWILAELGIRVASPAEPVR